jgi:prophage regulatory protein
MVGLSRSAIYDMRGAAKFPRPVKIGARAVDWLADDIAGWIAQRADRNQLSLHPPARESGPVSDPVHRIFALPLESKRHILSALSRQEYAELQRLRALELRVRQMHELHAQIVALLGPPGDG